MATNSYRAIAIVPAYNEQDCIVATIEDLKKNAPGVEYIIINDGSTDKTMQVCADHGFNLLNLPINLGLSGAFQTGMKYALKNGYDFAIQFDADGQHSASYICEMIDKAISTDSDIVIGSRFCNQKKPFSARMAGSILISTMLRLTTGGKIQDPTSGMRAFNRRMIKCFARLYDFGPEPDTLALLMRSNAKVTEVQVEMRDRLAGESYLNFTKSISYMLRVAFSILFVQWFRKKVNL